MVEFRLYYDENGKVLSYTTCELPGDNYIVIDAITYAESNPYVRVIDNKIVKSSEFFVISKLVENKEGTKCEPEDVCVLTSKRSSKKWKVEINEFRRN